METISTAEMSTETQQSFIVRNGSKLTYILTITALAVLLGYGFFGGFGG